MINASGHINIDTRVQISQHQGLNRQVILLDLALLLPFEVALSENLPELSRLMLVFSHVIQLVLPQEAHLVFELFILGPWQEAKHLLAMSFYRQ